MCKLSLICFDFRNLEGRWVRGGGGHFFNIPNKVQTDGRTHRVIIVHTCGSCNFNYQAASTINGASHMKCDGCGLVVSTVLYCSQRK